MLIKRLNFAFGIAKKHDCEIIIESEVGKETTFEEAFT